MSKHSIRIGTAGSDSAVAQPVERLGAALAPARRLELVLLERERRVARRELQDPPLLAALGRRAPRRARRAAR